MSIVFIYLGRKELNYLQLAAGISLVVSGLSSIFIAAETTSGLVVLGIGLFLVLAKLFLNKKAA